jgi:hypothetical protein
MMSRERPSASASAKPKIRVAPRFHEQPATLSLLRSMSLLLPKRPIPERCFEAEYLQWIPFESIAEVCRLFRLAA